MREGGTRAAVVPLFFLPERALPPRRNAPAAAAAAVVEQKQRDGNRNDVPSRSISRRNDERAATPRAARCLLILGCFVDTTSSEQPHHAADLTLSCFDKERALLMRKALFFVTLLGQVLP
jgi:hypothetical protein